MDLLTCEAGCLFLVTANYVDYIRLRRLWRRRSSLTVDLVRRRLGVNRRRPSKEAGAAHCRGIDFFGIDGVAQSQVDLPLGARHGYLFGVFEAHQQCNHRVSLRLAFPIGLRLLPDRQHPQVLKDGTRNAVATRGSAGY